MGLIYTTKQVTISQIGDEPETWDKVRLISVSLPAGQNPGTCMLQFPRAYALTDLPDLGEDVEVLLDDRTVFRGRVTSYPGEIGAESEGQMAVLMDPRWELARMRIGQKGIGPDEDQGFEEVGFLVAFNPGGRRNRSNGKVDGQYQFDTSASARHWTRAQILEWIAYWYMDGVIEVDTSALTGRWAQPEMNFVPYLMTVPEAITRLCRSAGASWGIWYDDGQATFVPIQAGGVGTLTCTLPKAQAEGQKASTSTEAHVLSLMASPSIERSADTVEVHTAPRWIEHTHTNLAVGDLPAILTSFTPNDARFAMGWRVDTAQYKAHLLGQNLPSTARPKRWLRHNLSTVQADGTTYYAAFDDGLRAGLGVAVRPEECFWMGVMDGSTETIQRVKSGFLIVTEKAQLLVEDMVEFEDGSTLAFADPASWEDTTKVRIYLTVTTEIEVPDLLQYGNAEEDYHLPGKPIVQPLYRSDLRPWYRHACRLPDLANLSTNPNATVTVAEGSELEAYLTFTTEMIDAAERIAETMTKAESRVRLRLLGIPSARLGQKLVVSPDAAELKGDEIVVDLMYDTAEGDHLTVTADRCLARLIGGRA